MRFFLSLWLLTSTSTSTSTCLCSAFTIARTVNTGTVRTTATRRFAASSNKSDASAANAAATSSNTETTTPTTPPPVLNGKMVLPLKVVQKGLEGHQVAGVYALLASSYKRGSAGWKDVVLVDTTLDLESVLSSLNDNNDEDEENNEAVSHVRALSFSFPQPDAMEDVAQQWRDSVAEAGGVKLMAVVKPSTTNGNTDDMLRRAQQNAMNAFDDEDDEWDDDDDDDIEMMLPPPPSPKFTTNDEGEVTRVVDTDEETIISPFAEGATAIDKDADLPFTVESVNTVLDEVRPYLIADGGNVSVDRVEADTKNVYLKLEGACGSCASSTVTMQMGIEKVLKENFADLGQVIQVDNDDDKAETELTVDMVMVEINRIGPAIFAMGGQHELLSVDGEMGVVSLKFKGPNKLQQGLELALLDIPLCNHVKFSMYSD